VSGVNGPAYSRPLLDLRFRILANTTWIIIAATLPFTKIGMAQPYNPYTDLEFRLGGGVLTETSTDKDEGLPRATLHGVESQDIRYRDSLAQDHVGDEALHIRISRRFHLIDFIDWLY